MTNQKKRPTELVDMAKLMSLQGVDPLVLSQVAGPGRPRKVRVLPLQEVVLGREEDCQIILDEDPVSRHHAKVLYMDEQPEILDLQSTNGTFLNGKQVHRAFLKAGDRVQVGTSVFQVQRGKDISPSSHEESETGIRRIESLIKSSKGESETSPRQSSAISGRLSEIRLTSLLQIIESDRSTGTLVVLHGGQEGKLHIHQGTVRHAALGRARGPKALYRIMAFEDGRFELFIPGRSPEYDTVKGNLQKHLLEAMRQKDELAVYKKQLPPPHTRLAFNAEKLIAPAKVPPSAFEVMAAVSRHRSILAVLEFCELPDFEVCRLLLLLLQHGIVAAESETTR